MSLIDLTITSPQTHFSIRTNLASLNTIPHKLSLSLYITNWSLPSVISKSPVYASSTSLLHLTLQIITFSSSDFPLGSASLAQLYSGSNPTCPLDPSPLKPAVTHLNPSHSPVVSLKGPLLFILYRPTTPLSHLIKSSSVDHHLYADDTQLFISFSPASFSTSIAQLLSVVNQISQWMSSNLLRLNPSKTEFII